MKQKTFCQGNRTSVRKAVKSLMREGLGALVGLPALFLDTICGLKMHFKANSLNISSLTYIMIPYIQPQIICTKELGRNEVNMKRKQKQLLSAFLMAALSMTQLPIVGMAEDAYAGGGIISFEPLPDDVANQTVPVGTPFSELNLPEKVMATVDYNVEDEDEVEVEEEYEEDEDIPTATPGEAGKRKSGSTAADSSKKKDKKTVSTVTGSEAEIPVTWDSDSVYDENTAGRYLFTADTGSYPLEHDVDLPQIIVTVEGNIPLPAAQRTGAAVLGQGNVILSFDELDSNVKFQTVKPGIKLSELNLPATLDASGYRVDTNKGSQADTVADAESDVPESGVPEAIVIDGVMWESDSPCDENARQGSYIFTPVLPAGYHLADGEEALPEIYVRVGAANTTLGLQNGVLTIQFDSNDNANMENTNDMETAITAALGSNTNDSVTTIRIEGNATEITNYNWQYLIKQYNQRYGWPSLKTLDLSGLTKLNTIQTDIKSMIPGNKLETVIFPNSITTIGRRAFYSCNILKLEELPETVTTIGEDAFQDCYDLKLKKLPDGLNEIGAGAFVGCASMPLEELPAKLGKIDNNVFNGCKSLLIKKLPDNVATIGKSAFSGCTNMPLEELPPNLKEIGESAFKNCTNLALKKLPESVSIIDKYAFEQCSSLTLEELPLNLKEIGISAFEGCISISQIIMKSADAPQIGMFSFTGMSSELTIYALKGSKGYQDGYWANLNVVEYSPITSVTLVSPIPELEKGQSVRLTARLDPADGIPVLLWESSDTGVARVDKDGTVTAVAVGTATITVTTLPERKTDRYTITVIPPQNTSASSSGSDDSTSDIGIIRGTWIQTENGIWMFCQTNGIYLKSRWGMIDGLWYYFDGDGRMLTGWQNLGSQWYYLCKKEDEGVKAGMKEGAMAIGWHFDSFYQKWFYFDKSGGMVTGWCEIDGKWYYLNPVSDGQRGTLITDAWIDGWYVDKNGVWDRKTVKE